MVRVVVGIGCFVFGDGDVVERFVCLVLGIDDFEFGVFVL